MPLTDLNERLEWLLDRSSCEAMCLAMATVCHEKAAHLASNWQDKTSARAWAQMGVRFTTIAGAAERRGV